MDVEQDNHRAIPLQDDRFSGDWNGVFFGVQIETPQLPMEGSASRFPINSVGIIGNALDFDARPVEYVVSDPGLNRHDVASGNQRSRSGAMA
jgi:hypothetical protein